MSPEVGVVDEQAVARALASDPDGTLGLLADMTKATDEALRGAARRLAGRLLLERARGGPARSSGSRRLRHVPADRGGDLDVDASLDRLLEARGERRAPSLEHLLARDWGRPALGLVVVVDRSGSMAGDRLATAALTAAACALRAPDAHAVVAFAKEVQVLRGMDSDARPEALVQTVLGLRGHGETGLRDALEEAARQLGLSGAERKVVLLLSDCRASSGQDARAVAARLPELVVLAPAEDAEQAEDLAAQTGARWAPVTGPSQVPALLDRLLA